MKWLCAGVMAAVWLLQQQPGSAAQPPLADVRPGGTPD
jgi:hypothetical protein